LAKLRRGFIKEANEYAYEFRLELNLSAHAPLCPKVLAAHLEIPILPVSKACNDKTYFTSESCQLSAAAINIKSQKKAILYNDFQSPERQLSSIAHEIAHIILRHEAPPTLHVDGGRHFDPIIEEEANRLGAILLLPEAAIEYIMNNDMPHETAQEIYNVSAKLFYWMLNKSAYKAKAIRKLSKKAR
jgi:Zn-dependent peptidase ImmA (M78 family)